MRKIIHIDMDAFYAAIEQRDYPAYQGKPLVVGGDPEGRGVVATCSYEARRYGIRSAMPAWKAAQLCPNALFVRPRMDVYREVSSQIHSIFYAVTELVEPLALDEAYLDVTENTHDVHSAQLLAKQLKQEILEQTGLTASAGVSFNKFLAKVASDWDKPNGLTVIRPAEAPAFVDQLPIRVFRGVGKVTEKKMLAAGIQTGADLKRWSLEELRARFGKGGVSFYKQAQCLDDRPVNPVRERKSIGRENTLSENLKDREAMLAVLRDVCASLERSAQKRQLKGRTVTLKLRYPDFQTVTRAHSLALPVHRAEDVLPIAEALLDKTDAQPRGVRLLGVSLSNLE